ncbi:BRO1-domain-containing protein [Hesseltinella vesiculosa]|uniref:BRO1-domain-containing protein n=1 Tax=Hesseltinella vesiculosa TaxID=101127 RepID=A0A1X2GKC4_9FUNG|nr:BRO1-domain-containing protein [Hesseltinella vesiculosa]
MDISAIERLFMYYSQLSYLTSRFPLDIGLEYSWCPAFTNKGKQAVKQANLNFERANIVFTIAAVYSQLGSTETRISTEGIRKSCNDYQLAAGCFKYVAREILPVMRCEPTEDLDARTLDRLIALMLAQAQECIWQKAVMEHMKHGTIARLAIKVADFFDTMAATDDEAWTEQVFPADWLKHAQIKAAYFTAVAQYHKANECISLSKYGEEIARLRIASAQASKALDAIQASIGAGSSGYTTLTSGFGLLSLFSAAPSALTGMVQPQSGFIDQVKSLLASIDHDLVRAEKDNNVVYLESIPDELQLAPILRSDMVKPTIPPDLLDPAYWKRKPDVQVNRPLFESLVPFAVHQAASVYMDKKEFVVKHDIIAKCHELIEEHAGFLAKVQLPARLEQVDPDKLPENIQSHAEEVQHDGGERALMDMLAKVENMSRNNAELVNTGFNILEEENERDDILRQHYGHLWARPLSKELTATLLTQGTQYHDTLQAAMRADRIVRAKVTNWGKAIHLLSQPIPDILSSLPCISKDDTMIASPPLLQDTLAAIKRLRTLLQEGKDIKKTLGQIIEDAERLAKTDDISRRLLAKADELTGGSPIIKIEPEQFNDVFDQELKKYQTLQGNVVDHANRQIDLHLKIQRCYEQLSHTLQGNAMAARRETALANLEQAFTKFKEIRTNLVEGIKFYSQYTDTMTQFRDDCNEFALSRKMEATELSKKNGSLVVPR